MQRFDDLLPVGIIARVATFASLTLACTGPTPAPDVPPSCTCEDQCNGGRACVLLDPRACSCRDGGVDIPATDTPSTDASMDATARDVEAPEVSPPPRGCEPPCARGNCCAGACVDLARDARNCGTCGRACVAGESCLGGACGRCSPRCADRACGDDGCGGSCGVCASGTVCADGRCAACVRGCAGRVCGDDGCGGSCGSCPSGQQCTATGTCVTCRPTCEGRNCGDDDGCGGRCMAGACPGGGTCEGGRCVGVCVPDCRGRECGSDGCGGTCGACARSAARCNASGRCECTPVCAATGFLCGPDGCGGACGSCTGELPVCGPHRTCVGAPPVIGCSDGSREGFVSRERFPSIAACAGRWEGEQNLRSAPVGVACGEPSAGRCPGPADLCASGWHVCMQNGWPGDLMDRISQNDCHGAVAGTGVFLAASDHTGVAGRCERATPMPCVGTLPSWRYHVDTLACGTAAESPRDNCCPTRCDVLWPNNTWARRDMACNAAFTDRGSDRLVTGVLCCRDPPIVGR